MAKFRQFDHSPAYLEGVEAALDQVGNNGMGFVETDKNLDPKECQQFWAGYHEIVASESSRFPKAY